jgi:hypothetical protein
MGLRKNIYYWNESLTHPEQFLDDYYIFDDIIVNDQNLIEKIKQLRLLIITYCEMTEIDENVTSKILDKIYNIIVSIENIQYTEFVAFWKNLDLSYSVFKDFKNSPESINILRDILKKYCEKRFELYNSLGYSNITVQALYDAGASRKKGMAGINKLEDLIKSRFKDVVHAEDWNSLENANIAYFLPDSKDEKLFKEFCEIYKIQFEFGKTHQGKEPDMVLKVNQDFFIIEAKHINESGGAQDKQIVEVIDFIKNSESSNKIHYLSFMDGLYFNKFSQENITNNKINNQKRNIEEALENHENNFFVNTYGFKTLLNDL